MYKKAIYRQLLKELISHGRIKTTQTKAKNLRHLIDRTIVRAKKDKSPERYLSTLLPKNLVKKVISGLVPGFANRNSGFTRIIKIGRRHGDNAPMVLIELLAEREHEQTNQTNKNK